MRIKTLAPLAVVAAAALALAGCTNDGTDADSSASGTPTATDTASASASATPDPTPEPGDAATMPSVQDSADGTPTLTFPGETPPDGLRIITVKEGDGKTVEKGDAVLVNYYGAVWGKTEPFDSSYQVGREPFAVTVGAGRVIPGWDYSLPGVKVGSRIIVVIPPDLGYGPAGGSPDGSISATDTIAFVIDVVGTMDLGITASATPADAPPSGITVDGDLGARPTIAIADGTAEPTELTTTVLAKGTGDALAADDAFYMMYTAVTWDGQSAGDTWSADSPASSTVSAASVFSGLAGVPVGSRVLIEVPANGNNPATAAVVDVIDKVGATS